MTVGGRESPGPPPGVALLQMINGSWITQAIYVAARLGLADLLLVIEGARATLEAAGVADRCELVGGSFFDAVPPADGYILATIIHGLDDERAVAVLGNVRAAMRPNGRLLLVEAVIPPGDAPHFGKLLDLEMLVMAPGGRERTEAEYRALYEAAGLRLTRVVPTESGMSVVEGVRA